MSDSGQRTSHKRYGRNKDKCAKYYNLKRLVKNKLRRFKKHNIGKDWPETKKQQAILDFENLHRSKHNTHILSK